VSIRGDITQRLVLILRNRGNSVAGIARLCDVSPPTVLAWMEGQGAWAKSIVKLADLTGESLPKEFTLLMVASGESLDKSRH